MKLKVLGIALVAGLIMTVGLMSAHAAEPLTWSAPVQLSTLDGGRTTFEAVVAPDGSICAVFTAVVNDDAVVFSKSSVDHGATWSDPVKVGVAGKADSYALGLWSTTTRLFVTPNNTLTAFFQDGQEGGILSSSSTDNGATWSTSDASPDYTLRTFHATPDNSVLEVWGADSKIYSRTLLASSESWSEPLVISDSDEKISTYEVAVTGDGTAMVVWAADRMSGEGTATDPLQASVSTDNGQTWASPIQLPDATVSHGSVQIAASADNSVTVAFGDLYGIIMTTTSVNHGVSWSEPLPAPVPYRYDSVELRSLIPSPDGTLSIFWDDYVEGTYVSSVFVSSSKDRGATWSNAMDIPFLHYADASFPSIVVSPDGIFTIVFNNTTDPKNQSLQSSYIVTAPTITSKVPPVAVVGKDYSFQFTAVAAPVPTFTVSKGSLPAGLTLTEAGLLSGTPTTAGEPTFSVTASNGTAPDAVVEVVLSVQN